MLETLTAESFEAHIDTGFTIRADEHVEVLTLTTVDRGKSQGANMREPFALLFNGSSNDLMFHSQMVRLEHPEMGMLDIMISPFGRNDDGTYRYEAVFG